MMLKFVESSFKLDNYLTDIETMLKISKFSRFDLFNGEYMHANRCHLEILVQ